MRIRLPLGRSLFFLCAFLLSLMALLPLRLAVDWLSLDGRGLAAREAWGSIWFGGLSEAQFSSIVLGDLQARLRTLPLFVGSARFDVERPGKAEPSDGSASVSRDSFAIDGVTARLDIGSALKPLPIASLDLRDVTARFNAGLCRSAEGLVKANLVGDIAGLSLPSGITGNVRCADGALLLPLVSQSGMEMLGIKLFGDGRYAATFAVRPLDDAMRNQLTAAGFTPTDKGYALSFTGNL